MCWLPAVLGCGLTGCGMTTPPDLPEPNADLGLGDVVMMTWTTRAPEGLLGHVLEPVDEFRLDPHRQVIVGTPRSVENDQTLRLVVSTGAHLGLGGGYGPVSGEAKGTRATHIAYNVRVTAYLEYAPNELKYAPASGCCVGGMVSPNCGDAYVSRLFRGTGTAQHLAELSADVSISASEVLKAAGGTSFRKLSESSFDDVFFAYELSSLEALCARLAPEEEMEALAVEAPKNCYLSSIDENGGRSSFSWTLPNEKLCETVATKKCEQAKEPVLACEIRFGQGEQLRQIAPKDAGRSGDVATPKDAALEPPAEKGVSDALAAPPPKDALSAPPSKPAPTGARTP